MVRFVKQDVNVKEGKKGMKISCSERLELSFTEVRRAEEHLRWEREMWDK